MGYRQLPPGRAIQFPCDRSIGLHVVFGGAAYVHDSRGVAVALQRGDIAFMARGHDHVVSRDSAYDSKQLESASLPAVGDANAEGAQLISGAYQFWNTPLHPLFRELPDWYVLRGESLLQLSEIQLTLGLLAREASEPRLGSEGVVHALLDVIFTFTVRRIVEERGDAKATWCHGLRDAQIARAIEQMHQDCARDWSLPELSQAVGMSRAAFAAKFREVIGEPPLSYLRTVRMQRAMNLLTETDGTLEAIAGSVGYRDAFGFSKVFKKTVGVSPREFRTRDRADRAHAFRL